MFMIVKYAHLYNSVRRLLKQFVESSSSVGDFFQQNVKLLPVCRLAVGRAQCERQKVEHGGHNQRSRATILQKRERTLENLAKILHQQRKELLKNSKKITQLLKNTPSLSYTASRRMIDTL
jgi:hypothetical protein